MKKWCAFLLLLALVSSLLIGCGDADLTYELNEDETAYVVTGVETEGAKHVEIPETHRGKPVEAIGVSAFEGVKDSLKSVTIPDSVTRIERYAFYECVYLTELVIPDSVTQIGVGALGGCRNLASLTLPFIGESKEEDENAFFGFIFGAKNSSDQNDAVPFALQNVVVTGAKTIPSSAFSGLHNIESVTLLAGVEKIGGWAFSGCTRLSEFVLPDSVTEIGYCAFDDTKCAKDNGDGGYYVGNCLLWLHRYSGVYRVKEGTVCIAANAMQTVWGYEYENTTLTGLILPEGLKAIGTDAFGRCLALTFVEIPASVTSFGSCCFLAAPVTEIRYGGTMAQWEAIEKGNRWDDNAEGGSYTVFCTDGEIVVERSTEQ